MTSSPPNSVDQSHETPDSALGLGPLAGRTFAGVLFDMDGTLLDSTPALVRAWTVWAIEYGVTEEQLTGWDGSPTENVVRSLIDAELADAALARIEDLEEVEVTDVIALPGALDAVAAAGELGVIATSATRPVAHARLRAAGYEVTDRLVTFDDVEHGKPAPDPFLNAAAKIGVDPADCLVIEDAPLGIRAARAAGATVVAVVSTNQPENLPADAVVPNLAAVKLVREGDRIRLEAAE